MKVVLYKKTDFKDFKRYINKAFHEKYILGNKKYLNWQYRNSLYLLKTDGRIVGHFGFRELFYKFHNQTKKIRVLINLFVLEEFRIFGWGALLVKKTLDTDLPLLVFGYRPALMPTLKHYIKNWREGVLQRYMAVVNGTDEITHSPNGPEIIRFKKPARKSIDALWKKIGNRFPVTIERDYRYLRWRFFNHPLLKYYALAARRDNQLTGLLIWRLDGAGKFRTARIIDFIADKQSEVPLLDVFLRAAKQRKIQHADFLFSGDFYKESLKKAGFFDTRGTKFEKYPLLLSPVSYKRREINAAYTASQISFSDCYFTRADGDQDRPNPH